MNKENLLKIHEQSLKILEEIGIEFPDEDILRFLSEKGVKIKDNRAYFKREEVAKSLENVISEFTLYARNDKYNMTINTESIYYAPPYGCSKVREIDGNIRDSRLRDNINFTKLVHASDLFSINGGILAQPSDVDAKLSAPIMVYNNILNSDKCILGMTCNEENFNQIIDMLEIVFGDRCGFIEEPRIITLVNVLSPLKLSKESIDTLKVSCKLNQPIVITPAPIGGATGPISLAGSIAQGNAEGLGVITLIQMLNPKNPIIYGYYTRAMDLRSGAAPVGSADCALASKYSIALSKLYKIPHRGLGSQSDACLISHQSGYESMNKLLVGHDQKSNFIIHSAGIMDAFASVSYEKFVDDIDVINMIKKYNTDIDKDEFSINNINSFLSKYEPEVINYKDSMDKIGHKEKLEKLYKKYQRPFIDEEKLKRLKEYMIGIGVSESILNEIENS